MLFHLAPAISWRWVGGTEVGGGGGGGGSEVKVGIYIGEDER